MNYTVYRHKNKTNGKVYIGITRQKPENRWKNGHGYSSQHFNRAIEKYGWDGFIHEIVVSGISKNEANEIERILIKAHKSNDPDFGYNETNGGDGGGMLNHHHTEAAKDKIRKARKKAGFTEEHKKHISDAKKGEKHHNARKLYQYSKNGEFIKEWQYMSKAAKELGINKANISEVCKGNRKTAGGFVWKYEKE